MFDLIADISFEAKIFQAIYKKDLVTVKDLFAEAPDKTTFFAKTASSHLTPLLFAARLGHNDIIDYLVTMGDNLHQKEDRMGGNALHHAALSGHIATFDHLVNKYELNPVDKSNGETTALHWAAMNGQITMVDHLVKKYGLILTDKCGLRYTALSYAAQFGHIAMIDHLVKKYGLNPADKEGNGRMTALDCAVWCSRTAVIDYLMQHYDFNLREILFTRIADRKIKFLLEKALKLFKGIVANDFTKVKACFDSMSNEDKAMIIKWRDKGKQPLAHCIEKNNLDIATLLLLHGASEEIEIEPKDDEELALFQARLTHTCARRDGHSWALRKEPLLLKSIIEGYQQTGPYQHLDREMIAQSLMNGELYVQEKPLLGNIRCRSIRALTKQETNDTRQLAIQCLAENIRDFPENIALIQRLMESFSAVGNGFKGLFSDCVTPLEIALNAIAIQSREIEKLKAQVETQENQLQAKELVLFSNEAKSNKRKPDELSNDEVPALPNFIKLNHS